MQMKNVFKLSLLVTCVSLGYSSNIMPYGILANDTDTGFNLPVVVTLNPDFPFYGNKYSSVTIQQHGFIVFGTTGVKTFSDLNSCSSSNNIVAIGVFVAQISNLVGNIFYRLTSKPSEMETLATLARNFSNFSPAFTPKYALIVTWFDVGTEHYSYEDDFKKDTFQLVIVTDGVQSLVCFNYDTIEWAYFEDLSNYQAYTIDEIYAKGFPMTTKAGFFKGDGVTCYLHKASNTNKMFYLGNVDPNELVYRVDEVPVTLTFTTASPSVGTTVPTSESTTPTSVTSTTPESTSATSTTPESTSATITTPESTNTTSIIETTSFTTLSTTSTSTSPLTSHTTSPLTSSTTSTSTSPLTSPTTLTSTLQLSIATTPTTFSTTDTTYAAATTTSETTTVSTSTPSGILSTKLTTASQTADRDSNEERIGLIVGLCLAALVISFVIIIISCLLCSKKYEACMCTLQCCVQRATPNMDTSEVTSKLVTTPAAQAGGPNGTEPVYNNNTPPMVLIPMPNYTIVPEPSVYFTKLPPIETTER